MSALYISKAKGLSNKTKKKKIWWWTMTRCNPLVSLVPHTVPTVTNMQFTQWALMLSIDFTFTYQAMVTSNKQLFTNAMSGCQSAGEQSKSADSAIPSKSVPSLLPCI